jgi:hypothetical protein
MILEINKNRRRIIPTRRDGINLKIDVKKKK